MYELKIAEKGQRLYPAAKRGFSMSVGTDMSDAFRFGGMHIGRGLLVG
ncbi:MAG: hypothetical protein WC759_03570 [Candidatus Micrarchaeia archaeon]|jgi:hypothetical protein